jgi:murein DD-endopeptidase MepM/ murein hydrolase activator NlpD
MNIWLLHPVPGARVSQVYGARPEYYRKWGLAGHEGIDYAVVVGTPVVAAADGVVHVVQRDAFKHNYGVHVRLKHLHEGVEWQTIYAHLSFIPVYLKPGVLVKAGSLIGRSGNTGNVQGGGHLHFSVKRDGVIVNPADFLIP